MEEEEGQDEVELSDSMVGSYISKFNTWAQTDDSKIQSSTELKTEEYVEKPLIIQETQGQTLGLYERSVSKMKSLGSGVINSYKEPLDNALVSGTGL